MSEITKPRGFAKLPLDLRREIAKRGGRSIPADKRFFAQNPEMARTAGVKGGKRMRPMNQADMVFLAKLARAGGTLEIPVVMTTRLKATVARLQRHGAIRLDLPDIGDTALVILTDKGTLLSEG